MELSQNERNLLYRLVSYHQMVVTDDIREASDRLVEKGLAEELELPLRPGVRAIQPTEKGRDVNGAASYEDLPEGLIT